VRQVVVAFASGLLFSLGLGISGMTQPAKVVGFLDFLGRWDPSLAFVMVGAIAVFLPAHRVVQARGRALFGGELSIPKGARIDGPLVVGSAIFGVGWGLCGYCPGPAVTSVAGGVTAALVFVSAMIGGIVLHAALGSPGSSEGPSTPDG
jgi:uncharacterized protein